MIKKMFINKLNQLYKPKRILYYIDASKEDIRAFYNGIIPPSVKKYSSAFGTYDYPGILLELNSEKMISALTIRLS